MTPLLAHRRGRQAAASVPPEKGGEVAGLGKEFKEFVLRGNVVDLAVAVVIGAAFGAIVTSLVEDIITPILGAIGGQPDFSAWTFEINDSVLRIGEFLNALISFLIIALAIFLLVVKPVNLLLERASREPPPDPTIFHCPECLSEVKVGARRCPSCTSALAPDAATAT